MNNIDSALPVIVVIENIKWSGGRRARHLPKAHAALHLTQYDNDFERSVEKAIRKTIANFQSMYGDEVVYCDVKINGEKVGHCEL